MGAAVVRVIEGALGGAAGTTQLLLPSHPLSGRTLEMGGLHHGDSAGLLAGTAGEGGASLARSEPLDAASLAAYQGPTAPSAQLGTGEPEAQANPPEEEGEGPEDGRPRKRSRQGAWRAGGGGSRRRLLSSGLQAHFGGGGSSCRLLSSGPQSHIDHPLPPPLTPALPATSRYRGVSFHTQTQRWKSQIKVGGRDVNLGRHRDEQVREWAVDGRRGWEVGAGRCAAPDLDSSGGREAEPFFVLSKLQDSPLRSKPILTKNSPDNPFLQAAARAYDRASICARGAEAAAACLNFHVSEYAGELGVLAATPLAELAATLR